jgi:hypothetical protein
MRPLRYTDKLTRLLNIWTRYFLKLLITMLAKELTAFMPWDYSSQSSQNPADISVFTWIYQMGGPRGLLWECKNRSQNWKTSGKTRNTRPGYR